MKLHNRTILITGATSGIGRALCLRLSSHGNRIVAVGRSSDKLDALKQDLPDAEIVRCNLASKGEVIALASHIDQKDLPVSVLINCAAVQYTPRFTDADFSFDSIETEITTNFTAVAWLTSLMLPRLMAHEDSAAIVNMSSGLAYYPKSSSALYCATKAALHSLSQSLRYQLEETKVGVSEILLPLVDTPMTEGRGSGKITAGRAASETIQAIEREQNEAHIGKAWIVPILNRISPALTKRILKSV
ncbi:SDR family oxidoreductase [Pseudomonadota bacterium]